ncbi:hypothetical protein [Roseibium polysiphoniae]|uniref:Uncharacterized protein n=1 Tax=Roseibium polysiphoniae TaxID=2571221 RepID=A0ABR9CE00_9HYPH|nr:hypothetical protein [Roseibium polysiphoniae]
MEKPVHLIGGMRFGLARAKSESGRKILCVGAPAFETGAMTGGEGCDFIQEE